MSSSLREEELSDRSSSRSSRSRSRSNSPDREAHEDWRAEMRYRRSHGYDDNKYYRDYDDDDHSDQSDRSDRGGAKDDRGGAKDDRVKHRVKHADRTDRSKYNIIMCFRCAELGHSTDECLTFKIKLCKHYMNGWCILDDGRNHCSYAHGDAELRKPWLKKCVRVWSKKNGDACVSGCGKVGHTYTECKLYQ